MSTSPMGANKPIEDIEATLLWAKRHVQLTGHRVEVSLYFDMRDEDWLAKLTPERRAELDAVRGGDIARGLARQLLADTKH
jgi:hypothetical protein